MGNHVPQQRVGLAAPQINHSIRVFVIDSAQIFTNMDAEDKGSFPDEPGVKQVFFNAHIDSTNGEDGVIMKAA